MGPAEKLGRNDPCPCGSGRKHKKCCALLEAERVGGSAQYSVLGIKELVLKEIESFKQIFDVKLTDSDFRLKANISDSDVWLFVERVTNLWKSKRDLMPHLPKATDMKFRSLYFGTADMFSTVNMLARYALYCDQIIVIDPFSIFKNIDPNFRSSPSKDPQAWVRQIVRDGVYLCSVEEWVRNDLVFPTAFPLGFDSPLRREHIKLMQAAFREIPEEEIEAMMEESYEQEFLTSFTPTELLAMEPTSIREIERLKGLVEDDKAWTSLQHDLSGISREQALRAFEDASRRKQRIENAAQRLANEPRRYQWALKRQFEPRMHVTGPGMNLLDAQWLASVTGSHLVTDKRTVWNQILRKTSGERDGTADLRKTLSALAEGFQKLRFFFLNDVPLDFALQLRKENRLAGFRAYLRDFWNSVRKDDISEGDRLAVIQEFQDRLSSEYEKFKKEFEEIRKSVYKKVAVGGITGAGAIASGSLAMGLASIGLLTASWGETDKLETKRANALSVFLDLERR